METFHLEPQRLRFERTGDLRLAVAVRSITGWFGGYPFTSKFPAAGRGVFRRAG